MNETPRPVTLQDIARQAGVSKMTVSLALRGHGRVAGATRDRLRALAEAMGYRPFPLVAAHMSMVRMRQRAAYAGTLGYVGRGSSPERQTDDLQSTRTYRGARARAEERGYRLEWFALGSEGIDGRRLSEILRARGIIGLVLGSDYLLPPELHLQWEHFAVATFGRTNVGHELHRATADYFWAVREICANARRRGYRRVGLALSRDHDRAHECLHRSAFLGCQADWPEPERVPVLLAPQWERDTFLAWVRAHRPDVIISCADEALGWLREGGYAVPGDMGLIRPHTNNRALRIAGFVFDDGEIGAAAVDLIIEQLHLNQRGLPSISKRVLMRGRWSEGRTLGAAAPGVAGGGRGRTAAKPKRSTIHR